MIVSLFYVREMRRTTLCFWAMLLCVLWARASSLPFVNLNSSRTLEFACPSSSNFYDPNTPYQLCENLFVLSPLPVPKQVLLSRCLLFGIACLFSPWRFLDCTANDEFKPQSSSSDGEDSDEDSSDRSSSYEASGTASMIKDGDKLSFARGIKRGDGEDFNWSGSSQDLTCNSDGTGYVLCRVLDGVPCYGEREFIAYDSNGRWCQSHTRARGLRSYPQAMILSALLGWCGADRIYMGYTGVGILKLFTLGGVGIWWFIDLVLLATGSLQPSGYLWDDWIPDTKT